MKNSLLLKPFIETLRTDHEIELRDEYGCRILNCPSGSSVLEYFSNREIVEWYASGTYQVVILMGATR